MRRFIRYLIDNSPAVYAFGNDNFNNGIITDNNILDHVTLSKIGEKFGTGLTWEL